MRPHKILEQFAASQTIPGITLRVEGQAISTLFHPRAFVSELIASGPGGELLLAKVAECHPGWGKVNLDEEFSQPGITNTVRVADPDALKAALDVFLADPDTQIMLGIVADE